MLRMIGLNVLAVLRAMTRREWSQEPVPWREVVFAARSALTQPTVLLRDRYAFN
jgi:hypothetical protein